MPMLNVAGIPIEVRRKNIKNLHLYVKPPDGHVLVTAPLSMRDETIERFVRTKADWLTKHVARCQSRPRPETLAYQTGETLMVWGRPYPLLVRQGGKAAMALSGGAAVLTARPGSTAAQREKAVREWYRRMLKAEIERRLPAWEAATGLRATSWQTKAMSTRWGTCNPKTGKLWFNVRLAEKPPECLHYIILHELLHLTERGHNARFYGLMDRYMPGWRERKALLNGKITARSSEE